MAASRWGRITTAFSDRRLKPRTVGWLCGGLAAVIMFVTTFGTGALSGMSNSGYSDDTWSLLAILATILLVTSGVVTTAAAIFGLPLWYGQSGRERAQTIGHAILALAAATVMVAGLTAWHYFSQDNSPSRTCIELCARAD
jgi:hypothetical protein